MTSKNTSDSLLTRLVDAGFLFSATASGLEVVGNGTDLNAPEKLPPTRLVWPKSISINMIPNATQRYAARPAKFKPRVPIKNVFDRYTNTDEARDYLFDSYMEHIERVRESRQAVIDARNDKHQDLLDYVESKKQELEDKKNAEKEFRKSVLSKRGKK